MSVFQISEYHQLLTLHKAVLEAKFTKEPERLELAGSKILADLANRIIDTLIQMENMHESSGIPPKWISWRQIDSSRSEWEIAIIRAKESILWEQWTVAEKETYASILLSPFTFDKEHLREFINEVENS